MVNKWISIEDNVPLIIPETKKPFVRVLIYSDGEIYSASALYIYHFFNGFKKGRRLIFHEDERVFKNVTHWMLMPVTKPIS